MTDPGTELDHAAVARTEVQHRDDVLPSDDEIRRMYRLAEALWKSRAFRDVESAERAFAKMIIGRDLGLSPAQAMSGIHLAEGGIMLHYATLGAFVRARPGYDFRSGWLKVDGDGVLGFVWHDEEDPVDDREVVGAAVVFFMDGEQRGLSRFTVEDARKANLIKDAPKAAWNAARRNMLLARAMSNGVKWFVPEVLGGMPVYAEGELIEARPSVTAPVGDGDDAGTGVDLGPEVEKIIARAERLGHRGLSNRGALELLLGDRAPGVVREWTVRAKAELDDFEREHAVDAEVVEEEPEPAEAEPDPAQAQAEAMVGAEDEDPS